MFIPKLTSLPVGTAQYQVITSGVAPFAPVYSGYLLDGTTGGKTSLAVTSGKILTLTAADDYNLTIPATGTALVKTGALTTGYIPFGIAGNLVGEDAGIFWDNTNKRLGIGTTGPSSPLEIYRSNSVTGYTTMLTQTLYGTSGSNFTDYFKFNLGATSSRGGQIIFGETGGGFGESGITFWLNKVDMYQYGNYPITLTTNSVERMRVNGDGNVGIGTTGPTNLLSLGGNSARAFWMERTTTASTPGFELTVQAGGSVAGGTNLAGGYLNLKPGVPTGNAEAGVRIYGNTPGASGTSDATLLVMQHILANKIAWFNQTPVVQQTGCAVPVDLTTAIAAITALRTALNAYGLTTSV